jgi:hypothetical protein
MADVLAAVGVSDVDKAVAGLDHDGIAELVRRFAIKHESGFPGFAVL